MGTIIAIGGGDYSNGEITDIFAYIVKQTKKQSPLITVFPTARFDCLEEDDAQLEIFRKLNCIVQVVNITDYTISEDFISNAVINSDAIYVTGGNLKYLMDEWKKRNVDKYLKAAYEKGIVLSGFSSGAMCWFTRGYDDCGEDDTFMLIDCLGLLPYCNCPHYEYDDWQSFDEAIKSQELSGIALEGGAALVYKDGVYSVLSSNEGGGSAFFLNADNNFSKTIFK